MDDISRGRRSGPLPDEGGTIHAKGPHDREGDAERATGGVVVDESALARGVVDGGAEVGIPVVEVPRVILDPSEDADDRAEKAEPDETVADGLEPAAPQAAKDGAEAEDEAPALSDPDEIARVSFALLLTQRDGVSPMRLAEVCGTTQKNVGPGLDRLVEILQQDGLPIEVSRTGDKIKLLTRPEVYPYIQRLKGIKRQSQLSPAALETLAVIAYRQPVIRAEIESIRGVKAGPMLRSLLEHKLVKVVGRADVPGRPLQYGTTQDFLERFGLESLKELPSVQEFKAL